MTYWLKTLLKKILLIILSGSRQLWWAFLRQLAQWRSSRRTKRQEGDARSRQHVADLALSRYVSTSRVPEAAHDCPLEVSSSAPRPYDSGDGSTGSREVSSAYSQPYTPRTPQPLPDDSASMDVIHRQQHTSFLQGPGDTTHWDLPSQLPRQSFPASARQSAVVDTVVSPKASSYTASLHGSISWASGQPRHNSRSEESEHNPTIPPDSVSSHQGDESDVFPIPMLPSEVMDERYGVANRLLRTPNHVIVIPQMHFEYVPKDLADWIRHVHPEGSTYFYHPEFRMFTISDLYDPEILDQANAFAKFMNNLLAHNQQTNVSTECVINVQQLDDGSWTNRYYCVDNTKRIVFWLQDYRVEIGLPGTPFGELLGCRELWHLKDEMETQYWVHWESFPYPHAQPLSKDIIKEVLAVLVSSGHDALISKETCSPYNVEDTQKMITFIEQLEGLWDMENNSHAVYVAARTIETYAHERALNYSGMDIARLQRRQFVYVGTEHKATPLIQIMSPFLFFAPGVHLKMLEDLWIDEVINHVPWVKFLDQCRDEWTFLIGLATVLLAVNTALLAIPSVDSGFTKSRSPVQILAYVSTAFSSSAILAGLFLINQHCRWTADEAAVRVSSYNQPDFGIEVLAITHALPYGALMWGMMTFFSAFCALVFARTDIAPRASFGVVLSIIAVFTFWCVYQSWEHNEHGEWIKMASPIGSEAQAEYFHVSTTAPDTLLPTASGRQKRWWKKLRTERSSMPLSSTQLPLHTLPMRRATPATDDK